MNTKHTPLPWRLRTYSQLGSMKSAEVLGPPHTDGGDYAPIATAHAYEGDAELIVRAVNAHAALVEALRAVWQWDDNGGLYEDATREAWNRAKEMVEAALALAEGKGGRE